MRGRVETQRHRGAEKRTIEDSQGDFSAFSVTLCFQFPCGIRVRGRFKTQRHRGAEIGTIEDSQGDFSVFSVTLCFQLPRGIRCAVGLKHRDTEAQR